MRRLTTLLILLLLLLAGLWLGGESLLVRELRGLAARDPALKIATAVPLRDPRRIGASMTGLHWQGQDLGLSLPQATLWVAPLRPAEARLDLPSQAMLDLDGRLLRLGLDDAGARLRLRPLSGMDMGAAQLQLGAVTLEGESLARGLRARAKAAGLGNAAPAGAAAAYDVDIDLASLDLHRLLPDLRLPGLLSMTGAGRVWLETAPGPANMAAGTRPALAGLQLDHSDISLGPLRLRASGWLQPDARGRAEGQIALYSPNSRQLLAAAADAGLIPEKLVALAGTLAEKVSSLPMPAGRVHFPEPSGDELRLPLTLSDGRISLGPLSLGKAPAFPR